MAFEPAIMVTRPIGQARRLMESIESAAKAAHLTAAVMNLPLLTIVPKNDSETTTRLPQDLAQAKLIIFVSPNAIECAMRAIADLGLSWGQLVSPEILVGVVGQSSKEALIRHGVPESSILVPPHSESDSEGLWKVLQTHITNWTNYPVLILKGEGGRESLMEHLRQAGALLKTLPIYLRVPLDFDSPFWQSCAKFDPRQTLWVLTSSEAVRHLGSRCLDDHRISKITIETSHALCSHPQIANAAREIGFTQILTCEPRDEAITQSALVWLRGQVKKSP